MCTKFARNEIAASSAIDRFSGPVLGADYGLDTHQIDQMRNAISAKLVGPDPKWHQLRSSSLNKTAQCPLCGRLRNTAQIGQIPNGNPAATIHWNCDAHGNSERFRTNSKIVSPHQKDETSLQLTLSGDYSESFAQIVRAAQTARAVRAQFSRRLYGGFA